MGSEKAIVVLAADSKLSRSLCEMIKSRHYRAMEVHSVPDLERQLLEDTCQAVLLDIDTVPLDNRMIRELTLKYPMVYFIGLCQHRYNPELKEAICYHIYACINKPVDPDELFYWLKVVYLNEKESEIS